MERKQLVKNTEGWEFPLTFNRSVMESQYADQLQRSLKEQFPIYLDRMGPESEVLIRDSINGIDYTVANRIVFNTGWRYIGTEFAVTDIGQINTLAFDGEIIELEKTGGMLISFPKDY